MAITETARRNHDRLFPDHVSTLADTDPELIEVFDNFAFDEVLRYGGLDERTRLMVQLASLIASHTVAEYTAMLGAALTVGVTAAEVKEVVYQAVPYVGMGRVFDVLQATNRVLTERGVELPLASQATSSADTRAARGREVQGLVLGGVDVVDAMHAQAPEDLAHIQDYLTGNCFGDHVSRGGIDLAVRELLTFAMLITLGGCEPQVRGHVRGNLNVGNDRVTLIAVVTHLVPFIGYPRSLNAITVINEVTLP